MKENDQKFIRAALEIARQSRIKVDNPFGAILVDENGHIILEAKNTVITEKDCTGLQRPIS